METTPNSPSAVKEVTRRIKGYVHLLHGVKHFSASCYQERLWKRQGNLQQCRCTFSFNDGCSLVWELASSTGTYPVCAYHYPQAGPFLHAKTQPSRFNQDLSFKNRYNDLKPFNYRYFNTALSHLVSSLNSSYSCFEDASSAWVCSRWAFSLSTDASELPSTDMVLECKRWPKEQTQTLWNHTQAQIPKVSLEWKCLSAFEQHSSNWNWQK